MKIKKKSVTFIIPCKDEELNIGIVIKDCFKYMPNCSVIVCDNCCKDNTSNEAEIAGAEVVLTYEKSLIMATYMLCGFANFSSIGIQIGGIGALAPNQRKNLAKFGIKALIGGALASLLSAAIAGMLIG